MAVISLAIHPADDPNGTALATLTDADVASFELRQGENELGSGVFTIRRDHPLATEANLATGNYIKVTIPQIQVEPVMGFWIDEHDDTLIASDEEGGEVLTRGGPGTLFILAHSRLLNTFYNGPLGGAARGNYDVPGYWTWATEPYGAIMVRLIEEGQLEPGQPLGEVSIDWNRTFDSDMVDWPAVNELIQFDIGTDGLTVFSRLIESGELFVRPKPDLTIQAYVDRGDDLTGTSYGAGVVRFVKGENILTELVRSGEGTKAATHAIVVGKDYTYRQVVSPDYSGPPGRWTTVNYGNSNDPTLLDKVGAENLRRRAADQQGLEFEFEAGDDPSSGRYFPFKHFRTGDLVSLDTGTAEWDYQDAPHYVVGFRIVLGEASDDATGELEAASLHWVVELNAAGIAPSGDRPTLPDGKVCNDCPPVPPRPPYVPGERPPDAVVEFCNTVVEDSGREGSATTSIPFSAGDTIYYRITRTAHDALAITDDFIMNGYAGTVFGAVPDGSDSGSYVPGVGGVFGAQGSADYNPGTVTTDECWRVEWWRNFAPTTAAAPQIGQRTAESLTGTTSGTDYTLNYPYASGSLWVWVSDSPTAAGVWVTPTEVDPTAGTFDLGFDATGQTVTVVYMIDSPTATGATNPQPTPSTSGSTGGSSIPDGTDPGDLLVWDGDSWEVLPISSDGLVLTADSGETLGAKWDTASSVALSDDTPLVESGSGDPGTGSEASRSDHVHPDGGASTGGIKRPTVRQDAKGSNGGGTPTVTLSLTPDQASLLVWIACNNGSAAVPQSTNTTWTQMFTDNVGGVGNLTIYTGVWDGSGTMGTSITSSSGTGVCGALVIELANCTLVGNGSGTIRAQQLESHHKGSAELVCQDVGSLVAFLVHTGGSASSAYPVLHGAIDSGALFDGAAQPLMFGFSMGLPVVGSYHPAVQYYTLAEIRITY